MASGSLAASPHASATEEAGEAGDLVLMDFGAIWHGYAADITRTVAVGRADDRQREAYAAVLRPRKRPSRRFGRASETVMWIR